MCLPHWNVIFKKILTSCQVPQWSEWIKIVLLDEAIEPDFLGSNPGCVNYSLNDPRQHNFTFLHTQNEETHNTYLRDSCEDCQG